MTVRFACRCGKKMKAPDDKIGKKVLWSACGSPVRVPESDTAAVDAVINPAGASETATELLRGTSGTQAKPRKHFAFDEEYAEGEAGYDIAENLRQIGFVLIPGMVIVVVVVMGAYWVSSQVLIGDRTPELGYVAGTVTLDGKPVKRARITFTPKAARKAGSNLSSSIGKTNSSGKYRLVYLSDKFGAVLGEHRVTIEASVEEDGLRVPVRFNNQRGLTAVVESGNNEINFELEAVED